MRLTDLMSNSGLAIYAEVALVLFMIAFVVIAIWIFRPSRKETLDRASRLPLEENGSPTDKERE